MSRLSELLHQASQLNPDLGKALEREVRHLESRRAFGLNFERHTPEFVDLYGRPVRLGDKVRMLAPRGSSEKVDKRIWIVVAGMDANGVPTAELRDPRTGDTATWPRENLVVVAEERDVIYPGLVSTGKVERGGDKPFHTVINGENLHALKALLYTHRGKVDAIYIDPPYNTGAKDWKYNNDYVADDDLYRHSKWLAFMERRLEAAKGLLNPADSVLIVSIDEKEYLRLGLLLEQIFPGADIQMVSSSISPQGSARPGGFSRVAEYIYFVLIGRGRIIPTGDNMLSEESAEAALAPVWFSMIRSGTGARREDSKNLFYPIYVDPYTRAVKSVGDPLPLGVARDTVDIPLGVEVVWPIRRNGTEGRWQLSAPTFLAAVKRGFAKVGEMNNTGGRSIMYVRTGDQARVSRGEIVRTGTDDWGYPVYVRQASALGVASPKNIWNRLSHDAGKQGSMLLGRILPGRSFPFPKSQYAVEDALRLVVAEKPDAVVLDFFAGSGTTATAVMRLNRQDGGRRYCISVTNNEVSAEERRSLHNRGLRQGDSEWERYGICDYITKPRIEAAITGLTPSGEPIKGKYKFADEFPMSEGFEENAEFFTLTYEASLAVASHREFARVAPLLWLRAGSAGRRIEALPSGWDVAEAYGVIEKLEALDEFVDALAATPTAQLAFVVTDDERRFQSVCGQLPDGIEPVRLYESYLRNFQIDARRSTR